MTRHYGFFTAGFLVCLFVLLISSSTIAKTTIRFNDEEKGLTYDLVRKALDPVVGRHEQELGRSAGIITGKHDLNRDGVPEIIAMVTDQMTFCNEEGCEAFIFAVTEDGLMEIGYAIAEDIIVEDTVTGGIKDLTIVKGMRAGEKAHKYIWNGERYTSPGQPEKRLPMIWEPPNEE